MIGIISFCFRSFAFCSLLVKPKTSCPAALILFAYENPIFPVDPVMNTLILSSKIYLLIGIAIGRIGEPLAPLSLSDADTKANS